MKLYHKFKAKPQQIDDIKFPSKLEANTYRVLKDLKDKGDILFFIRQPAFDLPGQARHKVDFMVFTPHECFLIESKGRDLEAGKLRRRQVEDIYNVTIHVVTSPGQVADIVKPKTGSLAAPYHEG